VLLVLPVRLEKKLKRLDAADSFICGNDQNVVKDERIRDRVRVNDRNDCQAKK
jgi:hypothetical protein